jgi:adenine phosphoribosyltransferase
MENIQDILKSSIRDIPDFPKKGIVFKDITTLLNNKEAYFTLIEHLANRYKNKDIDYIVGLDARGFIFGSSLATMLKVGFVPVRKKGKLPFDTYSKSYELEYGQDEVQIHKDAFRDTKNPKILLIDDLLATGGTSLASISLIQQAGGQIVESCFILNLAFLNAKEKLEKIAPVYTLLDID